MLSVDETLICSFARRGNLTKDVGPIQNIIFDLLESLTPIIKTIFVYFEINLLRELGWITPIFIQLYI